LSSWLKIPKGFRRARTLLRLALVALALLMIDATPGAAEWPEIGHWFDGSQPFSLGVESSRFRVSNLGTRPVISVDDANPPNPTYRIIDTDLRGSGVSLDLKLRWPSSSSSGTSTTGSLAPYLSFGPTFLVPGAEGVVRPGQPTGSNGPMALGLSWGAGLSWRFARNAELFGSYRFMQFGRDSLSHSDRPFSDSELTGHDFLYGINLRF